jgi:hypothetical protein
MGAFGRFMGGTKGYNERVSTMTAPQSALTDQMAQQGMQNTDFGGIENLETKRFNEQTIPSIMSRFMAHGQNQNSSAMQAALGGAGADLGAQLASLRSQYGLQQAQLGQRPQFENVYHQGTEGFLSQIAGPLAQAGLAYATGGLSGLGAMGRGAMDSYRGRPSGATQSAYQNLFGNRQPQQAGGLRPGYATPNYKTGAMTPMNQLPMQSGMPNPMQNATSQLRPGYATPNYKTGAMTRFGGPQLMQGPLPQQGQLNPGHDTGKSFSDVYPEYGWMAGGLSNLGSGIASGARGVKSGIDRFWDMIPNSYI